MLYRQHIHLSNKIKTSFFIFIYTGNVQTFTAEITGSHKLEVWGAQGGDCHGILGGRGGYSIGYKELNKNTKLYNVVGGGGSYIGDGLEKISNGGYNGGGKARNQNETTDTEDFSSGGGATHIAITNNRGVLANYINNQTEVLIVAGGGGGVGYGYENATGGYGGGEIGGSPSKAHSNTVKATGGTQTTGGTKGSEGNNGIFGHGGDCVTTNFSAAGNKGSGGGGGWYGGGSDGSYANSSAGGSGYVGNVTNGQTIAGNQTIPSPTGGTEIGHTGNGYCKITWHPSL